MRAPGPAIRLVTLVLAAATPVLCAAPASAASGWARASGLWSVAHATLEPGPEPERRVAPRPRSAQVAVPGLRPRFPGVPWAMSVTLEMPPGAVLELRAATGRRPIARLAARTDGRVAVRTARTRADIAPRPRAARAHVHRLELVSGPVPALAVDGRPIPVGPVPAVALTATGRRTATATALLVTRASAREALLLHRIGDLAARTPRHRFPFAEGDDGRLRFAGGWTSGFWPGALWSAADLDAGGPYGAWALDASLARMRNADSPTHDLGFMFGRSGLQAERRLCGGALLDASVLCLGLRAGPLAAADTLVRLAATNPAGTIPTDARSAEAETIIDSLMNLDLLVWAGRATGDERYPALARAHAHRVLAELLRPDGSTIQAVHFDRATGAVTGRHTHQGISADSTWSRGQAWAIYGFAQTGRGLGDPVLVAAAERAARWWAEHAPVGTPPPYDFSAPPGALRDSSAAMIAAAGLQRLAAACVALPGSCREPERWAPLATRVLDEGLVAVSAVPPLGRLGEQAYRVGPRGGAWDDRAEFIWGLDYALEAVAGRARR